MTKPTGSESKAAGPRVAVVTGGGGGIGAAIAEDLGRRGVFVVTVDPLVTLDGAELLPRGGETTADRIVAAGGSARASSTSVTDADAVRALFDGLMAEFGRLDAVVNVAGISRPTSFVDGTAEDWLDVLSVHLDGYRNVLSAALPLMAAAGRGRIIGVTSGSGWRTADAGAYSCAKRAVASLTWQLGRCAPAGVTINAISPIAVTRMVTAALERSRAAAGGSAASGGLALGALPTPDQLGPFGAHLAVDDRSGCNGQVIFAGGSEIAIIDQPRLLEVVRASHVTSLRHVLDEVTVSALATAEATQATGGGNNPRFGSIFRQPVADGAPAATSWTCAVAIEHAGVRAATMAALTVRGATGIPIDPHRTGSGFEAPGEALGALLGARGSVDAVIVGLEPSPGSAPGGGWERVLADHSGIVGQIHADAGWARAVADESARSGRPLRLVTLTDATTAGGRSRAQAAAQLARSALSSTQGRVTALSVSVEDLDEPNVELVGELAAHLATSADTLALSGAELVTGSGWFGLRSHPRPRAGVTFGGPDLPVWLDDVLRDIAGSPTAEEAP